MSEDSFSNLVKNDELLMMYGLTLYESGGTNKFPEISRKLRSMAKMITNYNRLNNSTITATEMIDPSNWDSIIVCVKELVNHEGNESVGTPSLLLTLGRSLSALASLKRGLGIKTKNEIMVKNAQAFLYLHEVEWKTYAGHAIATLNSKHDKTPQILPLANDLKKLRNYVINQIQKFISEFKTAEGQFTITKQDFSHLQKVTLVRLITFNARRGGEASKLMVDDFVSCNKWKRKEDIESLEDPMEMKLASRLNAYHGDH